MGANSKQRREAKKKRAHQQQRQRNSAERNSAERNSAERNGAERNGAERNGTESPTRTARTPGAGQSSRFYGPTDGERANVAIGNAKRAIAANDEMCFQQALDTLIALPQRDGQRIGCTVVESVLLLSIRALWSNGWQPVDAAHVVGKQLGMEHRSFLVQAVGIECVTTKALYVDERWRQQLVRIGAIADEPTTNDGPVTNDTGGTGNNDTSNNDTRDINDTNGRATESERSFAGGLFPSPKQTLDSQLRLIAGLRFALELIEFVGRMPALPFLLPPPGQTLAGHLTARVASSRLDEKILDRVRALLAKAESTTFEEEASALTSKAQELMARHAIDIAMLDSRSASRVGAAARRIHIDDPYVDAKCSLLSVVATENRCKAISTSSLAFSTIFGFDADLDIVELLFTSLLTQATTAMIAVGSTIDRSGRSRTKSFRQAFLLAFASRIGERLRSANESASEDAAATFGASLLPVLASRNEQVEQLTSEVFPKVRYRRSNISNAAGWAAGREAADKASIDLARAPIANR